MCYCYIFISQCDIYHDYYLVPAATPTLHTKLPALRYVGHVLFPAPSNICNPCDKYLNNAKSTPPMAMADLAKSRSRGSDDTKSLTTAIYDNVNNSQFSDLLIMRTPSDAATCMIHMLPSLVVCGKMGFHVAGEVGAIQLHQYLVP